MPGGRVNPLTGIMVLNFGLLLFVIHDALSKALMARYPLFELIFVRSAFALPLVVLMLRWEQGHISLRTGRFWALCARGALSVGAFSFFLFGLKLMPLAETFSIFMSAPLLVAALAGPLVGEPASRKQWVALSVGFCAVLFMVRPGGAIPWLGAVVMLTSVFCFSLSMLLTRSLGRTESASIMTVFIMVSFTLVGGAVSPFVWISPSTYDLSLMLLLGVLAAFAMFCTVTGYRNVAPGLAAPFQYIQLVWAMIIGFLVWGDVPERSVVAAAVIIVVSGVYVLRSEGRSTS